MAVIPIRDVPGDPVQPSGDELILIDNGIAMQKATINDAVTPKATEIADQKIADLNLGTAATANVEDFATAAQGAKADTAVQPSDLATVATTGDYADLTNRPTLGTAAAADISDFATAAQGAKADTAVQPGDLAPVATSGDYNDLVNLPTLETTIFATKAAAEAYAPTVAPDSIKTRGYASAGDGGGALYKKVAAEPSHAGKFSITLADGVTVVWYEIAEQVLTERMFGAPCDGEFDATTAVGTDATTMLQAWADCPVSNIKRFTGVSRVTEGISFPPGTVLEGDGLHTGVTGKQITSFTGPALVMAQGDITQISDLSADAAKGDTKLTLTSTAGLRDGDWICIYNPTDGTWSPVRPTYRQGEWVRIQRVVDGTTVNIMQPLYDSYVAADVDVYLMRSPQVIMRNFRVEPPFLDYRAGVKISTVLNPIVENVVGDGSQYASIWIERCVDVRVDTHLFQSYDETPDNEYGLVLSSVHGAIIDGFYYANRHGIAIGGANFTAGVPNRQITVRATTHNNSFTGSIDMGGHGCSEDCLLIGGTHNGLSFGGKNMRYVNAKFRKGNAQTGSAIHGMVASGSEFVAGDFVFDNCEFESFANPIAATGSPAPINIVLLGDSTDKCRFFFNNCRYKFDGASIYGIKIQINGAAFAPSVYVNGGHVVGAGLTQFLRLQRVSGVATFDAAVVLDVEGLNPTAEADAIVNAGAGLTITREVTRFLT